MGRLIIEDQFDTLSNGKGLEQLMFLDDEVWDPDAIHAATRVDGTSGTDTLEGRAHGDNLFGLAGTDTLNGDDGDDSLNGGAGADALNGGNGHDIASYSDAAQGVTVDLTQTGAQVGTAGGEEVGDVLSNIEDLEGSAFDDTLISDAGDNTLRGRGGADLLQGGDGSDMLDGGDGDDTLVGDAGANRLDGAAGDDILTGGAGGDNFLFRPEPLPYLAPGQSFTTGDFTYADDTVYGTSEPGYSDGSAAAPVIDITLGGIDNTNIDDMSGGCNTSFTLAEDAVIDLTFMYRADATSALETSQYAQAMLSIDGTVQMFGADDYIARVAGTTGSDDTGWQSETVTLTLTAGSHTIGLDGFLNRKTSSDETAVIWFKDVEIAAASGQPVFQSDTITDFDITEDEITLQRAGMSYADLTITDTAGGALITWDLDTDLAADSEITVENVLASALTVDVFEFV